MMKELWIVAIVSIMNLVLMQQSYAAAKSFKNCTELNKVHPSEVALLGAVNFGGATKRAPKFDGGLLTINKKSDRDTDGITCEK